MRPFFGDASTLRHVVAERPGATAVAHVVHLKNDAAGIRDEQVTRAPIRGAALDWARRVTNEQLHRSRLRGRPHLPQASRHARLTYSLPGV